ncbi:hypothetical protein Egran_00717 [Elaphomyces granulatus]|uniref:DUF6570 domain-containing protein n=1 Tax=Elaphomyces granulatus TaxID=519963 RepID=A0A232M5A8_9EURO|nr:hypothetical protein Egran_00717 [Elaphomyces granulatus]
MQNEANIFDELPTLPQDANILILRPANQTEEEHSRHKRRFQRDFKVRRDAVEKWLRFLKNNHPDYRHITISCENLSALPEDGDVSGLVPVLEEDPEQDTALDMENAAAAADPRNGSTIEEELPLDVHSMVPNLNLDQTETQLITAEVRNKSYQKAAHILAPDIRSTPIDEVARTQRIFPMAFPTLYSWGDADPNSPRQRSEDTESFK